MDDLEKLKAMLVELGKSQALWARKIQEFETLQSQISKLQRSAGSDPVARRKLSKLNDYMNREGNDVQRQVVERMTTADKNLKKVAEQLRELAIAQAGGGGEVSVPLNKAVKNNSRNFA
ncbi:hypothetical protein [Pseudomonas sp. TH31]|uniref:hypothetical protein n=1 Tax=Pseudomonas sp. TH31 TaxID=2796396 RepID=UPI00191368A2|nr:hypothetical protein [Pseudomonas sp. TH31]MBK5415406.1 hypothetical protein [Pseudomonas sp. TH31]